MVQSWHQVCTTTTTEVTPGTLYTSGFTENLHGWLKWYSKIGFNFEKVLYLSMAQKKTWSLSVLLSGSFHNTFLDSSLLICSLSWGQVQIWPPEEVYFPVLFKYSDIPRAEFVRFLLWKMEKFLQNQHHLLRSKLSVRTLHGQNLSHQPICDTQIEYPNSRSAGKKKK